MKSDLEAVLADIKKLTTSGRYVPRKTKNRLPGLWTEMNANESNDGYEAVSPEWLAFHSGITQEMVKEQLRKDREAASSKSAQLDPDVEESTEHADGSGQASGQVARFGEDAGEELQATESTPSSRRAAAVPGDYVRFGEDAEEFGIGKIGMVEGSAPLKKTAEEIAQELYWKINLGC